MESEKTFRCSTNFEEILIKNCKYSLYPDRQSHFCDAKFNPLTRFQTSKMFFLVQMYKQLTIDNKISKN